jgi:hypothetical protein
MGVRMGPPTSKRSNIHRFSHWKKTIKQKSSNSSPMPTQLMQTTRATHVPTDARVLVYRANVGKIINQIFFDCHKLFIAPAESPVIHRFAQKDSFFFNFSSFFYSIQIYH